MDIGEKIKIARIRRGLTQEELGNMIGVQKSAIAKYESGRVVNIKRTTLQKIADVLDMNPSDLIFDDYTTSLSDSGTATVKRIPVLGRVVAGIPIDAIEEVLDWEEIPESLARTGEFFALQVKGDSMSPRIQEGDVLIVRRQNDADEGDIVIAQINGDTACVKRLLKQEDGIVLQSFNPAYSPMFFSKKAVNEKPVHIIGKVIENRQKF